MKILYKITPFKISNKVTGLLFVTAKCSLPVKDLTEKNTLLPTQLIYNKFLGYEYMRVLGIICFLPVIHKMFNQVRDMENMQLFLNHCNHLLEKQNVTIL